MTAVIIKPTQQEWQNSRPDHMNASEMGVLAGVSKYGNLVELWDKKVNRVVENVENEAMMWGHVFEDGVAQIFEKKTGLEVISSSTGDWQFVRQEEPWMACSPDRTYWLAGVKKNARDWSQKGLLECKTTVMDPEAEGNEWLLQSWYCQVQWQLLVAEMKEAHLCCCVFGYERKTVIRHWPANPEFQAKLYAIAKDFWFNNVQKKVAPTPRTAKEVEVLFPEETEGKVVIANDETNNKYIELRAIKENIKNLKKRETELADEIKMIMLDGSELKYNDHLLFTYKASKGSEKFDADRFRSENPELYSKYTYISEGTRTLRIQK